MIVPAGHTILSIGVARLKYQMWCLFGMEGSMIAAMLPYRPKDR